MIKLKGFTQAAAVNSITQSAVSQRLKALEKRFGLPLIERQGSELHLTKAGEVVYKGAMRILGEFRELEERVQEIGGQVGGSVRVAAIYSVGLYELDPFVKRFFRGCPDIECRSNTVGLTKFTRTWSTVPLTLGSLLIHLIGRTYVPSHSVRMNWC